MSSIESFKDKYTTGNYPFPSDDINPAEKNEPQYSLLWMKAMLWNYFQNNCAFNYHLSNRVELVRAYMEGRQPTNIYKDLLLGIENPGAVAVNSRLEADLVFETHEIYNKHKANPPYVQHPRQSYTDLNYEDIYSPAPKIMSNLLGKFEKYQHEITVDALDEKSAILKKKKKAGIAFDAKFKPQRDAIREGLGLEPRDEVLPQNNQELDLWDDLGGTKLPYESAMEKCLSHSLDISDDPQVSRKLFRDFLCSNMAATMDRVDIEEQKVYEDYIDFQDLIIEYSRRDDFTKSRFAAYPIWMTTTQVKEETGMTDAEFISFAMTQASLYNNPAWSESYKDKLGNGSWVFADWKVLVLYGAWITVNQQWDTVVRNNKNGAVKTYPGEFGKFYDGTKGTKSTVITNVEVVYHAKWIPDSDIIWNYGMMNDIPRDEKGCVRLPFHVYKIPGKSIGEQLMTPCDMFQLAYLNYQNGMSKCPPPGIAIDIDGIANLKWGGQPVETSEYIRLYNQVGIALYKGSKAGQPPGTTPTKPFEILEGGAPGVTRQFIESINAALGSIANITGIDPVTLAQDNKEMPVTVTKLGIESTNDTLVPIVEGYRSIKESWCRNAASRIQLICMYNDDDTKGYTAIVGEDGVKAIAEAKNRKAAYYGISIKDKPNDEDKRRVMEALQVALTPGKNGTPGMKPSQWLFLTRNLNTAGGVKTVEKMLAFWENQRDLQDMQVAQVNSKTQSDGLLQLEDTKNKNQLQLEEKKSQLKVKELFIDGLVKIFVEKQLSDDDFKKEMLKFGVNTGVEMQQQQLQPGATQSPVTPMQ